MSHNAVHPAVLKALAPVMALFFTMGFITSSIDPLIPAVQAIFRLNIAQSLLTQFAFFGAYLVVSLPAAWVLARWGSAWAILLALSCMLAGCLLVPLATWVDSYWAVLGAIFVIAGGVTQLQVAINPLAAGLGAPEQASFRLTVSQALNSAGTVLGPYFATLLILNGGLFEGGGAGQRQVSLRHIDHAFLLAGLLIAGLTGFVWLARRRLALPPTLDVARALPWPAFASAWAWAGAATIFLYVGAEVSISSVMINFLHQPQVLGASLTKAGELLSFYWFGAMAGRFGGSVVLGLTRLRPAWLLAGAALAAGTLCLIVIAGTGTAAALAALSIGLFNSVMFPTIFTLTLARSAAPAPAVSGLMCVAIVGGAILPQIVGRVADQAGLSLGFIVPGLAYLGIAGFALAAGRAQR